MATLEDLHEDVLAEILCHVPGKDLILNCRLVCRLWRELVDRTHIWKEKCIRERAFQRNLHFITPNDWMKLYFIPLAVNLIKNPSAEEDLRFWSIDENGGDEWNVETLPGGHGQNHPCKTLNKYFVTSYGLCRKSQIIDLSAHGLWGGLLDFLQPKIVVSDWYAGRHDCGCMYALSVELLSEDRTPIRSYNSEEIRIPQWSDVKWNQITHVFENYGPGVRYVHFSHEGRDTQFWAGWYGVRVTNSSVTVEL
ncbi:F-box only protein 6-like [Scyliorhinus canicula]|uniref:F-box only protein 6-like n=1 Tax=Scyliorhinus canicula TaxID=7830 RepID=UPI0018F6523A|nr:F-box only protein 6-like [Scyliorhinus canicula]XP_038677901.1 F-box only protein 6-like [Scyliorhinus canicula]XP_038677902.1 F-box only protein 6-like [Scyliorhinus canicula]